MRSLLPIRDLFVGTWLRFKARTLNPMAPAHMHVELALALADIERRA